MTDAAGFAWWVVRRAEDDCELPIVLSVLIEKGRIKRGALWTRPERVHTCACDTAWSLARYHEAREHLPVATAPGTAKSAAATAVAAPQ